jgi:DNA-binding response OmpR family regulator
MSQDKPVLVVDDDPEIREMIATVLEQDGYNVDTASNGAEALSKANEHQPGAIILDAMMPVMDGWEFLARWHDRPAEQRAPVLVVTSTRDWRTALDLGAQAYLSKPFDLDTLETTLAGMLDPA